jgi:hypothetical protein
MNPTNTKRLFTEFPNLYCDKDQPNTVSRMCDGFYCDDGWFDLVYKTSSKLEKLIQEYKRNNPDDPKPPRAFQVKQKFGALVIYMSHYTDEMRDVIDEAEVKSHRTCEKCGCAGKVRDDKRFVQSLCENHFKNR